MSLKHADCVDLLADMVRIDSINTAISHRARAEQELGDYFEQRARLMGFESHRLPVPGQADNLIIICKRGDGLPWLLFESHMDTIGTDDMVADPFAGIIKDGALYGRGACDTKGSAAAMLSALAGYIREPVPRSNVALLLTVDEEVSRSGINAFLQTGLPRFDWRPIGAVVGEPTQLRLASAHRGAIRFSLRTHGIAAHSSEPSQGRSAIRMMLPVLNMLEHKYGPGLKAKHPLTGPAVCSVNVIRGGTQVNVIPGSCEIEVDRRTVPGEDPHFVVAEIEALLARLLKEEPDLRVSLHDLKIHEPLDPAVGPEFATGISRVLAAANLPNEVIGVGYGSHASALSAAGIPSIVLGPGDIAQAHSADEWLDLEQLDRAVDVYQAIMQGGMGHSMRMAPVEVSDR